jgi:hypothetical protein
MSNVYSERGEHQMTTANETTKSADEMAHEKTLTVECPLCLASPGRACTDPRGETTDRFGRMVLTHKARWAKSGR